MNQSADKKSPAVVDAAAKKPEELEIRLDAWERFRTAVHVMTRAGPQHRISADIPHQKKKRPIDKSKA